MSVAYKRKAPVQLTPSNLNSDFNNVGEPGQFKRADPETLKARKLVHVPKQTTDNFFDDDSDICLDDDFADASKTSPSTNTFSNAQTQGQNNSTTLKMATDSATTDSSAIPSWTKKVIDENISSTITNNTKTDTKKKLGSSFPSFKQTPGDTEKPSFGTKKPSFGTEKPSFGTEKPSFGTKKPSFGTEKPSFGSTSTETSEKPSFSTEKPSFSTEKPSFGITKKSSFGSTNSFGSFSAKTEEKETEEKEKTETKPSFGSFTKAPSFGSFKATEETTEETEKPVTGFGSTFGTKTTGFSGFGTSTQSDDKPKTTTGFAGFGATSKSDTDKTKTTGFSSFTTKSGDGQSPFKSSFGSTDTPGFGAFGSKPKTEEGNASGFSAFGSGSSFSTVPFEGSKGDEKPITFGSFVSGSFAGFGGVKKSETFSSEKTMPTEETPLGAETAVPTIEKPAEAIPTGEEDEETLCEEYTKLYKFVEGKFEAFSQGNLKLNKFKNGNRYRLILRTEGGLKLMLNAGLFKGMEAKKRDEKSIALSVINFCDPEPRVLSTLLIRFRTADEANRLFDVLDGSIKSLN